MIKSERTSSVLVLFVLGAMSIWAFIFAGCSRDEKASATPPAAASSAANDPVFRQKLAEKRAARHELANVRGRLVRELEKKFEAKRLELNVACANGAPLARPLTEQEKTTVRAALENDAEWKSLCQRCKDANEALRDNLKSAQRLAGAQLAPKGPAKASKNISK